MVASLERDERPVTSVTTAPQGLEGEGFPVRRAFAGLSMRDLDPFVHMDQMGEVDYAPGRAQGNAVAPPPRLRDGDVHDRRHVPAPGLARRGGRDPERRDAVDDGGKGILHIETPPEELVVSGGLFHGIQLWVNLPAKDKMISPAYQGLEASDVVFVASPDAESLVRIIAGDDRRSSWARLDAHADGHDSRVASPPARSSISRGTRRLTPWSTCSRARATSAATVARRDGSARGLRRG